MIDLHTHTNKSDGTLSPEELIRLAKETGLKAIAVTDHDTVAGVREAIAAGEKYNIRVVPAIEISTEADGYDVHVVGLFIDIDNPELRSFLSYMNHVRSERNLKMIDMLSTIGLDIHRSDFPELETDTVMTKGNMAREIVKKGYASSTREAIEKYLKKGAPAYVPRRQALPGQAIDAIHAAGGKAFIAHFHQIVRGDVDKSEEYCRTFLKAGADGLETRYSEFDDELNLRAEKIASDFGCLRSGGSDYHGVIKPDISLGTGMGNLHVPDSFLDDIEASLR